MVKVSRPFTTVYLSTRSNTIGLISSCTISSITWSISVAVTLKKGVPPGVCSNKRTVNSSSKNCGALSLTSVSWISISALAVAPSGAVYVMSNRNLVCIFGASRSSSAAVRIVPMLSVLVVEVSTVKNLASSSLGIENCPSICLLPVDVK